MRGDECDIQFASARPGATQGCSRMADALGSRAQLHLPGDRRDAGVVRDELRRPRALRPPRCCSFLAAEPGSVQRLLLHAATLRAIARAAAQVSRSTLRTSVA